MELLLPPRPSDRDESVAALVKRHFGQQAVDRLADPLLSGIFGGDASQLSARTVLPKLVEMGSPARLAQPRHARRSSGKCAPPRAQRASTGPAPTHTGPRGIFTTLRGGMQQLIDALEARLDPAWIRRSTPITAVQKIADGWRVTANGITEDYDAVLFASPAWTAGALLTPVDPALGEALSGIPYSSSITVNLVYDEAQLGPLPEGFGFLVPAVEGRAMLACTFAHRKFLGRTPTGKVVLRAFLGGARNDALLDETSETLVATVRRELSEILGERIIARATPPEHTQVSRWRRAMAQYAVGHQDPHGRHSRTRRRPPRPSASPATPTTASASPTASRLGRQAARDLVAAETPSPVR